MITLKNILKFSNTGREMGLYDVKNDSSPKKSVPASYASAPRLWSVVLGDAALLTSFDLAKQESISYTQSAMANAPKALHPSAARTGKSAE